MYSLSHIAKFCEAQTQGDDGLIANWQLLIDSRLLSNPENTIFFALKTQFNDGHKFIPELVQKGVKAFVVANDFDCSTANICLLKVKDTQKALQDIAAKHRNNFSIPIIGITGSNGKTIVKEWLGQLLDRNYSICASPKSFNSQLGVPLSIWGLNASHTLGIFEAGISTTGEMRSLQEIIRPTIGILTHLGPAHNQGFDSPTEKLFEKLKLFRNSEILITRHLDEVISNYIGKTMTFGFENPKADLNIIGRHSIGKSTEITAEFKGRAIAFRIPFRDEASIENACLCALTLLYLDKFEADGFQQLQAVSMRQELKKGIHNCLLVNDSYSNDLHSLSSSLAFLEQHSVHSLRTVILSDIEESGLPPNILYPQVKRLLLDKKVNRLIGIGQDFIDQSESFKELNTEFYKDTRQFLDNLDTSRFRDESILVKGARKFAFERIISKLQQESHGSILEINLSAALHNLNAIKATLDPKTRVMAMVKAFAYGSGTYEMAKLICNKVDYLAVAYTDEGVALRKNNIETPIMVMNPEEDSLDQIVNFHLEPVIFSLSQFKSVSNYMQEHYPNQILRVHLELDTGMHRLGFLENELDDLLTLLAQKPNMRIASIFSHLSASDEVKHDDFTRYQFEQMKAMSARIMESIGYPTLKHISNTAATLRFKQDGLDMVRLGIGLYGVDPTGLFGNLLEPVFTLKTAISQIKEIRAHESVGYSRKSISDHKRRIAILALGYADGLNRALSNGKGGFYIRGKFAPIAGNICMDMCMADVTEIDCEEGDEAILFGKDHPIEALARALGTIPYEVLTSISQRVKRVYVSE